MSVANDYDSDFCDGLTVAVALIRAGANVDDLASLLPIDMACVDPMGYQEHLGRLRRIMGTQFLE